MSTTVHKQENIFDSVSGVLSFKAFQIKVNNVCSFYSCLLFVLRDLP
jgi:hypothetical protein